MAAAKEDLDDLIGKKASGGVAAAIAAAQGGSPARSPSRKGGSVAAAIVAAQGSPPATSQPSASPAGPPDESSPSPSTAAESPAKPAPIAPPAREAKGFLLSARRAPSPRAARPPPQEEEDAVEDEPEAESSPEAGAAKEAVPTNTHLSGNARPNKRQGIGKNADGTPRKPSTPKSSTPSKGSKAKGSKSASSSPSAESVSESGPMISRRPGASQNLMPTLSTASIGGGPPGPFEEEEEEEDVQQYGTVPQMWQESLAPKGAAEDLSNEVNVTVKSPKQSRLSRLTGGKKQRKAAKFVPKARLAYYGTIGGGFGTPRLGFAAGQFNTPTWMATQASGDLVVSSTFAHEVQVLSPRGGPAAVITSFQDEHLHDPQGIAIDFDSNSMWVSDGGNGRVLKFSLSKQGVWMPVLSSKPGLLDLPQGLALDGDLLFVVCGRMDRIHVLDANKLTRLFSFGHDKPDRKHNLSDPTCIAVYHPPDVASTAQVWFAGGRARKLLYVTDTEADRLAVYNMDGDFVAAVGSNGRDPGFFIEPLGISIREEQVFVAEGGRGLGGRLQILKPDGTPLLVLPAPTGGRLVGVHWHDTRLYVSEIEAHRLHAFKIIE